MDLPAPDVEGYKGDKTSACYKQLLQVIAANSGGGGDNKQAPRVFASEIASKIGAEFCQHNSTPETLADMSAELKKQAAARQPGLCGHHHAWVIAAVKTQDVEAKWGSTTGNKYRNHVKPSFEDGNSSLRDPFKNKGLNASATIIPIAVEARKRAPGYLAYSVLVTGIRLFLTSKAATAINVAYVAMMVARSHESVEAFCKDEGKMLLESPSIHLALVGTALRVLRFRLWRGLLVKSTLFRLRYQLRFMRLYRPRWLTTTDSPLEIIVRDTVQAARSAHGLLPDLCHQAALVAEGCQLPHWSECNPPQHIEKGWAVNRRLDRRLKQEFGKKARRVRAGDDYPLGPGFLGWRVPHRVVFRITRRTMKRPPHQPRRSRREEPKPEGLAQVVEVLEEDVEQEDGVIVEVMEEPRSASERNEEDARSGSQLEAPCASSEVGSTMVPAEGPLIRFHQVTAIASRGSMLTKSYRALAELPYGDGSDNPGEVAKPKSVPASGFPYPEDKPAVQVVEEKHIFLMPSDPQPPALQPVVIKRNLPRQLLLAEDDVAAARRALRRMTFKAEIDLDMSGVVSAVATAVARAGDLRFEAENIERVRRNLKKAGMLGSIVDMPEVVSCPELGLLARPGILVTTALRGVDVSDSYVMGNAVARGEKEKSRFVDKVFTVFGQMCLTDGCFPSNPMPDNILYMYSGQVGLTDLSSVTQFTEEQRRALCRLYRTMAELKGEDAANPSAAAELKAKSAMEGVGLVIDLPPAGGISWVSSSLFEQDSTAQEAVVVAAATAAERVIEASLGETMSEAEDEDKDLDGGKREEISGDKVMTEEERGAGETGGAEKGVDLPEPIPSPSKASLTHVMLLRGLFDTEQEEALALVGVGGVQLLRGMAVRRLPQSVAPMLRMVANLRGICARLGVNKSLLPRFSRAASKGLSWRLTLASSRGGGNEGGTGEPGSSERLTPFMSDVEEGLLTQV